MTIGLLDSRVNYPERQALYQVSVRHTKCLLSASFRSHLAVDTLAYGYRIPVITVPWRLEDGFPALFSFTTCPAHQEDAYGAAISDEIEQRLKREVNLSAVHVTLYRLEDKGLIKSSMGGGTKERGGRRKRIFTVTSAGMAMLRAMKEARIDLWKLVPQLKMVTGF